jgi:hypothetical protein
VLVALIQFADGEWGVRLPGKQPWRGLVRAITQWLQGRTITIGGQEVTLSYTAEHEAPPLPTEMGDDPNGVLASDVEDARP